MAKRSTRDFFNDYAEDFSDLYGRPRGLAERVINVLFRRSMKLRFVRTIEECRPLENRRVLDLGCGPGRYAVELAIRGAAEVLGLDFAEQMISLAERRAAEAGVGERCRFTCGDILSYPVASPFDFTVAMGLADYISDIGQLLKRIAEVTSQKAVISFPRSGGFLAWQRKLRYRKRCDLFLYSRSQIQRALEDLSGSGRRLDWNIEPLGRDFFVTLCFEEDTP